ncbi:MAG: methylmalonyl Co-A mutase-associated GTPase MeaB [Terrimicrobiaceae bacterium]
MDTNERVPAWVPEQAQGTFATKELIAVPTPIRPAASSVKRSAAPDPEWLAAGVLAGDRTALARAITLVESNSPAHRPLARRVLEAALDRAGSSRRIGISGVPGVGKSTFIEAFGNLLCDKGHRVAVLAVDPSSQLSGGSILGDKTRMETLSRRQECFIRPSPSAGALGGVARKTRETILLCEAAGHDVVLVETVGVGQSETEVRSMVDCFLLLMLAGAGDELQGIKKGIIEIADLLAVNKADGDNRQRALATRAELERVVDFLSPATEGWKTPVVAISSSTRTGLDDLLARIESLEDHLRTTGQLTARRHAQALTWWRALVEQELRSRILQNPELAALSERLESKILQGRMAPSLAAEEFLAAVGGRAPAHP